MCDEVKVKSYIMSCCPEGTYVRQSSQLLSFKAERDPACPQIVVRDTEDPYQWVVIVGIVVTVCIVIMYLAMWILLSTKGS